MSSTPSKLAHFPAWSIPLLLAHVTKWRTVTDGIAIPADAIVTKRDHAHARLITAFSFPIGGDSVDFIPTHISSWRNLVTYAGYLIPADDATGQSQHARGDALVIRDKLGSYWLVARPHEERPFTPDPTGVTSWGTLGEIAVPTCWSPMISSAPFAMQRAAIIANPHTGGLTAIMNKDGFALTLDFGEHTGWQWRHVWFMDPIFESAVQNTGDAVIYERPTA